MRDHALVKNNDKIESIFTKLLSFKQYESTTYYHYACYRALQKNKKAALDNIKKSLNLGFGNYFMLMSDDDLSLIQNTPEYVALLKKYFPDKIKLIPVLKR